VCSPKRKEDTPRGGGGGGRGEIQMIAHSVQKNESNKNKNLIISYFFVIEKMIFNMQKGTEIFIQRVCKI
jgi:hypothetical protein